MRLHHVPCTLRQVGHSRVGPPYQPQDHTEAFVGSVGFVARVGGMHCVSIVYSMHDVTLWIAPLKTVIQ